MYLIFDLLLSLLIKFFKKTTCKKIFLLLNNTLRYNKAFNKNGIKVIYFLPNMTLWKQLIDIEIIVALKKCYKYNLIKDLLDFYNLFHKIK